MSDVVDVSLANLNDCGCCEGITVETPVQVENRPGLTAIAYRVGTHSQFKDSMLARLSLSPLTTRSDNDFSIALLDAWATVADVLTFYQERIANESYLRTATERLSLLQLARLIGYNLRPGVAASTYLAFTLEDAKGAPGRATIDIDTKVQSIPGPGELPQTFETVEKIEANAAWNALKPQTTQFVQPQKGDTSVFLKGTTTGLKPGDGILFVGSEREREGKSDSEQWDFRIVTTVTPDANNGRTLVTWDRGLGIVGTGPAPDAKCYAFRKRAALFGSNAPDVRILPKSTVRTFSGEIDASKNEWKYSLPTKSINLDAIYSTIVPTVVPASGERQDSWAVLSYEGYRKLYLVSNVSESSPKKYTLTTKTTELTLDTANNLQQFASNLRSVLVFAQSEQLDIAESPILRPLQAGDSVIAFAQAVGATLAAALAQTSGQAQALSLQTLIISGKAVGASENDPFISEVVHVKSISSDGTTITIDGGLQNTYDRSTVTIYGNVALATHGETVAQETLGNGDASQPYQQFTLRQSPLTYVSAATASGATSTLTVRVNDIQWHEVPTLYGQGPKSRVFVTKTDDDGKTTVEFGDGVTGARLPTGQGNVQANYRKGSGTAGLVKAGQLSLLMTRPLGVKAVTNPEDATGATDPEVLDDARRNAPLTVLTLDRVVSLQDYEDFTRAFAGIAKALATWTWSGQVRGVFVTVAGPNGAAVPDGSLTYKNLLSAIQKAGDPYVPLRVQTYRPAFFKLAARVKVDSDYQTDQVLAAVEKALRSAFSFDARAFGQPVTQSEVIAIMQAVAGVVAVDLYKLYRSDGFMFYRPATTASHHPIIIDFFRPWFMNQLNNILPAATPQAGSDGQVRAAELLTLDPAPLYDLGVML